MSPEHPILEKWADKLQNLDAIRDYQALAQRKSDFERTQVNKDKTGVEIKGVRAINPATGKEATFAQRLLVVMLGMPSSNTRYKEASRFLRDGWNAWDAWLPTNDYLDRTKFILLPE
jgi:hypothetical protein